MTFEGILHVVTNLLGRWMGELSLMVSMRVETFVFLMKIDLLLTDWMTYLLTYSMDQCPFWEANRFSASQEIRHILWNPKVHHRIHNCLPTASILSQLNPVHIPHIPLPWRSILILSSHLQLGLPSGLFPSGFPHQNPVYTSLIPIRATCPTHLIFLDFIIWTIFCEQYGSLTFWTRNYFF